ncbi:MAG: ATP-dependent DNA helicase [Campylobacter sp.]
MENIKKKILTTCNNIDKNLDFGNLLDERGFVSKNILSNLRTFVEHIFQMIYCDSEVYDSNKSQECINKEAQAYIKSQCAKFNFLSDFHSFLQKSTSHYILNENSSERLMLKYLSYLIKCKQFLVKYDLHVLNNLYKFPINLDKNFIEYYEKIAEKIDKQEKYHLKKDTFYVTKIKPFFVKENIYYEITFVKAIDNFSKFDKLIAFSKFEIFDNYAVDLWICDDYIKILDQTIQIKIIRDWKVSIRPSEFGNFAKIFYINKKFNKTKEYQELMKFLTQNKMSLVKFIDSSEYKTIKNDIISNTKTEHIFDILDKVKNVTNKGKNTIRYLLNNLRNSVIKKQVPKISKENTLNLQNGCIPFDNMPFATSLLNHNPSFNDLIQCISTEGREHEIFARSVKNKIENNGVLFVDKREFEIENLDELRIKFNNKLWPGNQNNPKGHTGRKIEEFKGYFYINDYVEKSIQIIDELNQLTQSNIEFYSNLLDNWLENYNEIDDKSKQKIMESLFRKSRVALIYGAAGTGKTTLINYISKCFNDKSKIFLANTNSAVDNLKRRIETRSNAEFKTISKIVLQREMAQCDVLIMDECSTIDNAKMYEVLNKVQFDLLILVGDTYQIEAISFGNWFKIARDFLRKDVVFDLETTYRTQDEKLLKLWDSVRKLDNCISEILQREDYSQKLEDLNFDIENDEIVLCLNYDGLYGINNLNNILQEHNHETAVNWRFHTYKIGDPVLFNETERFKPLIYNNMKGKIVDIEVKERKILFSIELEKRIDETEAQKYDFTLLNNNGKSVIQFYVDEYASTDDDGYNENNEESTVPFYVAYAISIHKAQGLEYDSVKIVISNEVDEMITHNIFYTAITRAKKNLKIYYSAEVEKKILESFKKVDTKKDINIFKEFKNSLKK